jgi:capsular polysaccharide biosynthesis protein
MTFSELQKKNSMPLPKGGGLDDSWTDDEFTTDESLPTVERGAAYVSLGFIVAALKRSAWACCAIALIGLILGYGVYAKYPPAISATTSILVANNPNEDPTNQSATNVALAESQGVAQAALKQLGLTQSVTSFMTAYTVTASSSEILIFKVNGPSASSAVQRAGALAAAFLQARASYLNGQQQLQVSLAQQQLSQAQKKVDTINGQIAAIQGQAGSSAELRVLQARQGTADSALANAQGEVSAAQGVDAATTEQMIRGSQILNSPSPVKRSLKNSKVFYLVVACIAGLAIGAAVIVIRALVSSRLRNRDDIASAIGAPVLLSTGEVGTNWLPRVGRRKGLRRPVDRERVVAHLDHAVPRSAGRLATLAVVAVDNAAEVAPAVVSLAQTWASRGEQVVLADLSAGAPAARQLGARSPGVHRTRAGNAELVVSVPGRDDPAPVGPLPTLGHPQFGKVADELAAASASADFLLTLVTPDPLSGSDYLRSWSTEAVAVVSAGQSTSTRIRAVGEMVRLAGVRLASVVLLRADKYDESLGAALESSGSSLPLLAVSGPPTP